jgi:hypothetical protein
VSVYYVKNGGNDGNSGLSDLLAWETIAKVQSTLTGNQSDNSVLFKRGSTWREKYTVPAYGTSGHPFTIGAYDSGANPKLAGSALKTSFTVEGSYWYTAASPAPLQAFFDGSRLTKVADKGDLGTGKWWWDSGNSRVYIADNPSGHTVEASSFGVGIDIQSRSWLVFDGLTVTQSITQGIVVNGGATASANNVWQNCIFSNNYFQGIKFWSGGPALQSNNIVQDCEVAYNGGSGVQFQNHTPDGIIRRNYVHHNCILEVDTTDHLYTAGIKVNCGEGMVIEENYVCYSGLGLTGNRDSGSGIWLDSYPDHDPFTPCEVRYNRIHGDYYCGIRVEITHDARIYGNVVSGTNGWDEAAGICVFGHQDIGDGDTCEDNLIYNNTVYGCTPHGIYVLCDTTKTLLSRNLFKNNISIGNTMNLCAIYGGDNTVGQGTGNTYWYNCFGAQSTGFIRYGYLNYYATYAAWEADSKVIKDGGTTHSIQSDPLLTNPTTHDFTLQADSPCINAGVNLGETYKYGLMHDSAWPAAVVLGDQGVYGEGWEIGAYIYESASSPWIVGALAVGGS